MSVMSEWIAQVCRELGLELADPDTTSTRVLELTADVAHGVARPAAPVTAFLVGLAAGGSADPEATVEQLCRSLGDRARAWSDAHPG